MIGNICTHITVGHHPDGNMHFYLFVGIGFGVLSILCGFSHSLILDLMLTFVFGFGSWPILVVQVLEEEVIIGSGCLKKWQKKEKWKKLHLDKNLMSLEELNSIVYYSYQFLIKSKLKFHKILKLGNLQQIFLKHPIEDGGGGGGGFITTTILPLHLRNHVR